MAVALIAFLVVYIIKILFNGMFYDGLPLLLCVFLILSTSEKDFIRLCLPKCGLCVVSQHVLNDKIMF